MIQVQNSITSSKININKHYKDNNSVIKEIYGTL